MYIRIPLENAVVIGIEPVIVFNTGTPQGVPLVILVHEVQQLQSALGILGVVIDDQRNCLNVAGGGQSQLRIGHLQLVVGGRIAEDNVTAGRSEQVAAVSMATCITGVLLITPIDAIVN